MFPATRWAERRGSSSFYASLVLRPAISYLLFEERKYTCSLSTTNNPGDRNTESINFPTPVPTTLKRDKLPTLPFPCQPPSPRQILRRQPKAIPFPLSSPTSLEQCTRSPVALASPVLPPVSWRSLHARSNSLHSGVPSAPRVRQASKHTQPFIDVDQTRMRTAKSFPRILSRPHCDSRRASTYTNSFETTRRLFQRGTRGEARATGLRISEMRL